MSKGALNGILPIKQNTFALRADLQYVLYMSESEQGFQICLSFVFSYSYWFCGWYFNNHSMNIAASENKNVFSRGLPHVRTFTIWLVAVSFLWQFYWASFSRYSIFLRIANVATSYCAFIQNIDISPCWYLSILAHRRTIEASKKDTTYTGVHFSFDLLSSWAQGCIFRLTCSHRELTKDHVLTSAHVKIFKPSREMP